MLAGHLHVTRLPPMAKTELREKGPVAGGVGWGVPYFSCLAWGCRLARELTNVLRYRNCFSWETLRGNRIWGNLWF